MSDQGFSKETAFNALAIFDWGFRRFVTISIVKVLYVLGIAVITFASLAMLIAGFRAGFAIGVAALFTVPILFVIWVLSLRVYLELIVALFRIAENTSIMAARVDDPAPLSVVAD